MKLLITLILIGGLSAGGFFLWKSSNGTETKPAVAARPTTATVETRDIHFEVNSAGEIGPADQVSVRPEVNGRIAELPVDIGDKVKKEALLCRLDDRDLQIERSQRLIEIDGSKLQLQKAARNFSRARQLFTDKLIAAEAFDDARTDFDLATNSLDRANQTLSLVEDRISKTKILAPFDCTVLTRPVSLGQTVSGSGGFNSGTEVMTIANLNDMIVNAHINQADVTRLTPGQSVDIQVEAVPGLNIRGVLDRIAPQAVIKNGMKGFSSRIQIKQTDARIRPGMTAILSLPVASAENVLTVPISAIFTELNGERYVFVKNEDKLERRVILIGVTDTAFAEVQQGLSAGETVSLEQTVAATSRKPAAPGTGKKVSQTETGAGGGGKAGSSNPEGTRRKNKPPGS